MPRTDPTAELAQGPAAVPAGPAGVPDSVAPPAGQPRFPLIDALRAIAALSILVFHAGYASHAITLHGWGRYVARLDAGVAIFFVITGFLLYRPFVSARIAGLRHAGVGRYAWKRALRILPAYWVALTVLLALGLIHFDGHWLLFYGLAQVYDRYRALSGLGPAWSLCIEVSFYIALPLLAIAMRSSIFGRSRAVKLRAELIMLGVLYVSALAFRAIVRSAHGAGPYHLYQTLPGYLDWFALGMALAVASVALSGRELPLPRVVGWVERFPLICWLLAAALFWVTATRLGAGFYNTEGMPIGGWLGLHALYGAIGLLLVTPAVLGWERGGLPREILRHRVLAWLGLVSYGIFLYNQPLLGWLERSPLSGASMLSIVAAGAGLTVLVAAASYYLLEEPLLRAKRVGQERPPLPPPAARRSAMASTTHANAMQQTAPTASQWPGRLSRG